MLRPEMLRIAMEGNGIDPTRCAAEWRGLEQKCYEMIFSQDHKKLTSKKNNLKSKGENETWLL